MKVNRSFQGLALLGEKWKIKSLEVNFKDSLSRAPILALFLSSNFPPWMEKALFVASRIPHRIQEKFLLTS